jgi:GNAT superfamily N-acetyltransferase
VRVRAGVPRPGAWVETSTWPPLEVHEVGGWRVGLSGGFTRRGNSAVPQAAALRTDPAGLVAALDRVEELYAAHGLPSTVRVGPDEAPELDARLGDRGYQVRAPTSVMVSPTASFASAAATSSRRQQEGPSAAEDGASGVVLDVADHPGTDWLAAWLGVKAGSTGDHALAARLLRGGPARYLTARDEDGVVGVLRAAPCGRWVGLSCLSVVERARRRGLGRRLTERALAEATAPWAVLQVEASNQAAAALYAGLGFVVADRYHYRRR